MSPAREGLGINSEDDPSAVGAALNLDPLLMTKGRVVTFIRISQIGWTERNTRLLHCAPQAG